MLVGSRYEIGKPIGRGGMATIYRGYDRQEDRPVAIKVLREVYNTDATLVARFRAEAQNRVRHPNLVQVYDHGTFQETWYIVKEFVEGTDLRRLLRARGMLDVAQTRHIGLVIAEGLDALHRRNMIHGQLKPKGILLGEHGVVKLTDVGIATFSEEIVDGQLITGLTLGTNHYIAPEQLLGNAPSPASDIYALGILLYEMLTGRTPFDDDTPVEIAMKHIHDTPIPPRQINPEILPVMEAIILRCMEKMPERRYRDGAELAHALELWS